jgi:hypothetical protein
MACGIEIMDIPDNVSATDSEDLAQMEAADDVAERLHATNPWLRDDNRYTSETVGRMPRSEFDRRRELHLIYGTTDPDEEIDDEGAWGARALRDTSSLQSYMDQRYHPDDYELFNEPTTYKIFINTHGAGPGFQYQRRSDDVERGSDAADPLMGDGTDESAIDTWFDSIPDDYDEGGRMAGGWRLHPIDDAYTDFHRRQLEDLEGHGDRRVREAQAVRQQANQLAVLQGAASRLGRSDGGYGVEVDNPDPIPQRYHWTMGSKRHRGAGVVDQVGHGIVNYGY